MLQVTWPSASYLLELLIYIGHVIILDSSPSNFDLPSETTSNMASKMLAIKLWVVRKFNLEIFCLNVYGNNDETMILYEWNELQ